MTKKSSKKTSTSPDQATAIQPEAPTFYLIVTLIFFFFGLFIAILFKDNANDPNVNLPFYYFLLVILAFVAAGFLFGVMRSIAKYRGKQYGGTLEIAGPAVIAILLVIGGYFYRPAGSFDLTVYVHGPGGMTDRVLKSQGHVIMELGQKPWKEPIRENGDAHFDGIPSEFFKKEVLVMLDAEGFVSSQPNGKLMLDGESLYFEVKRDASLARIAGTVKNSDGVLLPGVSIRVGKLKTTTDADGYFELSIPPEHQKKSQKLTARLTGYQSWEGNVFPGTEQDAAIIMTKMQSQ